MKRVSNKFSEFYFGTFVALCCLVSTVGQVAQSQETKQEVDEKSIAILGDSLGTGAAAHPALTFETERMWQIFAGEIQAVPERSHLISQMNDETSLTSFGKSLLAQLPPSEEQLRPPKLVAPNFLEFTDPLMLLFRYFTKGYSDRFLNTHAYSWGYLFARSQGYEPQDIIIAAENGRRAQDFSLEAMRVHQLTKGKLPKTWVVYFTGNDLCGLSINHVTPPSDFARNIRQGILYIASHKKTASPLTIYLPSFLSVLQILTEPEINESKRKIYGNEYTCQEMRERGFRFVNSQPKIPNSVAEAYFNALMPPNPQQICPTLFGPERLTKPQIPKLATIIRKYRSELNDLVQQLKEPLRAKGVQLFFLSETQEVRFTGNDMAADCFHLNLSGQLKIAKAVADGVNKAATSP